MFTLLLSLLAPAHATPPAAAAWSSAGAAVGAGATMFVPATYGYSRVAFTLDDRECGEFPDCEGYGVAVLVHGVAFGGGPGFGVSAAAAGAISHGLTVKHGAWKVLLAGGATALASTGLTVAGLELVKADESGAGLGLMGMGFLGNVVGVPLAVGLASGGEARAQPEGRPEPALTGIGLAPLNDGASVSVSLQF